jgi:N-acetylglutamate synthase-like GNAT family acetyltransferase
MISIQESSRYTEIIQFFIENELEFTEDQKQIPDTVIKYWEALDGEKLVGASVLGMREGAYVLEGIAIDAGYRKKHIGERFLGKTMTHLKTLDAKKLYLCARAPGFFKAQGFITTDRADAPYFGCNDCDQFGVKCFPEIMVKNL